LLALPVEGNSFPIPARLGGGLVRTSGSCWYQSPHDRFICPVYSDERIDDGVRDGTVLRLIGSTGCEVIATRIDHWAWGDQRYFHFRTDPSVSSDMLNACFAKESAIDVKYGPETLVYPPMASGVSKLDRTGGGCAWETGYSRWRCPINPTTVIKVSMFSLSLVVLLHTKPLQDQFRPATVIAQPLFCISLVQDRNTSNLQDQAAALQHKLFTGLGTGTDCTLSQLRGRLPPSILVSEQALKSKPTTFPRLRHFTPTQDLT
jgi:hypothetical protein